MKSLFHTASHNDYSRIGTKTSSTYAFLLHLTGICSLNEIQLKLDWISLFVWSVNTSIILVEVKL